MRKAVLAMIIGTMFSLGSASWNVESQAWASQITFVSPQGPDTEIFTMNSDGTVLQNLTNSPAILNDWPAWSPDRKQIAFVTVIPPTLYLMDADGRNVKHLRENYPTSSRPAWSPDGTKIAFVSLLSLHILDLETQEERKLIFNPGEGLRDPAWSPNGRLIAFTIRQNRQRDIYVINPDGTQLRQLTKHPAEDHAPAWSPDGQKIAFFSSRNNKGGIYLMDADGSNLEELTDGGEDYPSWSPDGSQIAFSVIFGDISRVGVMNADGHKLKLLAEGRKPSWQSTGLAVHLIGKLFSIWGLVKLGF